MIDPVAGSSDRERAYAEAMVAELDWAPLHFDGWTHYEQARPVLPGETIEVIGRWPERATSPAPAHARGVRDGKAVPDRPLPIITAGREAIVWVS